MAKLPEISGKDLKRILLRMGFRTVRSHGSHEIMKGHGKTIIVPVHETDIPKGTLEAIIKRELGMSVIEFVQRI